MPDIMTTHENAPRLPGTPKLEKHKGVSRKVVGGTVVALTLAAAAGLAAINGVGRQGTQSVETPIPTTAASEPPRPTATQTETPKTPEPSLSPQQEIDLARKAHQDALAKGEYKIPIPKNLVSIGGRIEQGTIQSNSEIDLFAIIPPNTDITFPSLVDGKVIEAHKANPLVNMIIILADGKNLGFLSPVDSNMLVKAGDPVSIGTPLFSARYNPESVSQKNFENAGEKKPAGTIAIIGIQDPNAWTGKGFEKLTIDKNLLNDSSGKPLTIPTIKY